MIEELKNHSKQGSKHESTFTRWLVRQDYNFEQPKPPPAIEEWFDNVEYKPVEKVSLSSLFPLPSLPFLKQVVDSFAESARRISARRRGI